METIPLQVHQNILNNIVTGTDIGIPVFEAVSNSLDADATEINIDFEYSDGKNFIHKIIFQDNGTGISEKDLKEALAIVGYSNKTFKGKSHNHQRTFLGKQGIGILKLFILGKHLDVASCYFDKSESLHKKIVFSINFSELIEIKNISTEIVTSNLDITPTYTKFIISNLNECVLSQCTELSQLFERYIKEKFSLYRKIYTNFELLLNKQKINLEEALEEKFEFQHKVEELDFKIKCFDNNAKIFNQNSPEVYFYSEDFQLRGSKAVQIKSNPKIVFFVISNYFNEKFNHLDSLLNDIAAECKNKFLEHKQNQYHDDVNEIIQGENYPYKQVTEESDFPEKAKKALFDNILEKAVKNKLITPKKRDVCRLMLEVIKQGVERNDSRELKKILESVIRLPSDVVKEVSSLLEENTLEDLFKTMTIVVRRLEFIDGLNAAIFNNQIHKNVLERKDLQKILEKNLWIFGEEYNIGALSDASLKSVLEEHIKLLNREQLIGEDVDFEGSSRIPDFCIFKQFVDSNSIHKNNLVIEIKRPSLIITNQELNQIQEYAQIVSETPRFEKDKTKWKFILLASKINPFVQGQRNQANRDPGLVYESSDRSYSVWVLDWSAIINNAQQRLLYLKKTLNHNSEEEATAFKKLMEQHPEQFKKFRTPIT